MRGGEFHEARGELLQSVVTNQPGFEKRFGMPCFQFMTGDPERHRLCDTAMEGVHGDETESTLEVHGFSAFKITADVGRRKGSALAAILKRHPAPQGILFDLPAVAERARSGAVEPGVSGRRRIEGGDLFDAVPGGADA
jgi:hypothetical protein